VRAGLVTPHTELAARVLCNATPTQVFEATEAARNAPFADGDVPNYEQWRQRIALRLTEFQNAKP